MKEDASDLDLTALPMTDALRNSTVVELSSADASKPHDVVVVVKGSQQEGKSEHKSLRY